MSCIRWHSSRARQKKSKPKWREIPKICTYSWHDLFGLCFNLKPWNLNFQDVLTTHLLVISRHFKPKFINWNQKYRRWKSKEFVMDRCENNISKLLLKSAGIKILEQPKCMHMSKEIWITLNLLETGRDNLCTSLSYAIKFYKIERVVKT